jgi:hypothetical protein
LIAHQLDRLSDAAGGKAGQANTIHRGSTVVAATRVLGG